MRTFAFVCLAATAAAMRPAMRSLLAQQKLLSQHGWVTGVDEASGATYYTNTQTGQSQWEPPQVATPRQAFAAQVVWRAVPGPGVNPVSQYSIRNGEEQKLGRHDMYDQNAFVSRLQCVVAVAGDGAATATSIGKQPTLVRAHSGAPWTELRSNEPHILVSGEEIGLYSKNPDSGFFTIVCEQDAASMDGGQAHGVQYSDDGQWMWNGAEWVPAMR